MLLKVVKRDYGLWILIEYILGVLWLNNRILGKFYT